MKTLFPSLPWTLALVCALSMGGAWGQSGPSPAHVQAAQQKLQMIDISAEQRLAALRQSLLKTAMEGPTEVRASSFIDGRGVLREASSFVTGMEVRGIRVMAYGRDMENNTKPGISVDSSKPVPPNGCKQSTASLCLDFSFVADSFVASRESSPSLDQ
jgi:hypothetical protein